MPDAQPRLIELPAAAESAESAAQRRSSKTIGPGDIVEVDKKGRRFHALVRALEQQQSGRFELELTPLDSRISYYRATVREVVGVWRKARNQHAS